MTIQSTRAALAATIVLALAACATGHGITPASSIGSAAERLTTGARAHYNGKLILRIHVPKKQRRRSHYISASTAAITIAITGPTNVHETAALLAGGAGCTPIAAGYVCTVTVPGLAPCAAQPNCYSAAIATYDAITGCPSACAIPGDANKLSGNQNLVFNIGGWQTNQLHLTIDGIPTSVAFLALGGTFRGERGLRIQRIEVHVDAVGTTLR
jgi:hypothetical protein